MPRPEASRLFDALVIWVALGESQEECAKFVHCREQRIQGNGSHYALPCGDESFGLDFIESSLN